MLTKLMQEIEFGKREELNDNKKITCCGGDLRRDGNKILVSYDSYLKKICPITIPKGRDNKEKLTDQEKTKCRGLLALQWPGGQGMPAVCTSTVQAFWPENLHKVLAMWCKASRNACVLPEKLQNSPWSLTRSWTR